jgi:hypothetical protein
VSSDNKSRLGNFVAGLSTHNGNGRAGACTCVSVLINWRCAPQVTPRRCPTTTNTGPAHALVFWIVLPLLVLAAIGLSSPVQSALAVGITSACSMTARATVHCTVF